MPPLCLAFPAPASAFLSDHLSHLPWDKWLRCLCNVSKWDCLPSSPSIPQSLPFAGYDWHTLPPALNSPAQGLDSPSPTDSSLCDPAFWLPAPFVPLASSCCSWLPSPPSPHTTQGHVHSGLPDTPTSDCALSSTVNFLLPHTQEHKPFPLYFFSSFLGPETWE